MILAIPIMCTYVKSHLDQMYSLPTVECTLLLLLVVYDTMLEANRFSQSKDKRLYRRLD